MNWQQILKGYNLEDFIIQKEKGKPIKEKTAKEIEVKLVPGIIATVVITAEMDRIIKEIEDWYAECNSLTKDDIGIKGDKGTPKLIDHLLSHWDESVKRPKQETKHGSKDAIEKIMKIIREEDAYTKQDLKIINDIIEDLKSIEKYSRTNPKNIIFTEQITPQKKRYVRGHYRTDWYERKTGETAVPSEWYDDTTGPGKTDDASIAKPPLWQALFAGVEGNESGDKFEKGLLQLLIELEEEIPKQPITDIRVWGKQGREKIIELTDFMRVFRNILKDQGNYHSVNEPFKRLQINNSKIRRVLAETPFQIPKSKLKQKEFKRTFGLENYVTENLTDWRVVRITPGLIRSIIVNSTINTDKFEHGSYKGIFLTTASAAKAKTEQKDLWETEYKKAKREKNLPWWAKTDEDKEENVQKSWTSILKIMPQRPMPQAPGNPAAVAQLHYPTIFNKEKQKFISRKKGETCDYCEKNVALDCRRCNQKLCEDHLDKPCVKPKKYSDYSYSKKSYIIKRKNIPHGTKVAGGEITAQDLRRELESLKSPNEPNDPAEEKNYLIIGLPRRVIIGGEPQMEAVAGLFTWDAAKEQFGETRLRELINMAEGIMGAQWVSESDLPLFNKLNLELNRPLKRIGGLSLED